MGAYFDSLGAALDFGADALQVGTEGSLALSGYLYPDTALALRQAAVGIGIAGCGPFLANLTDARHRYVLS